LSTAQITEAMAERSSQAGPTIVGRKAGSKPADGKNHRGLCINWRMLAHAPMEPLNTT